MKALSMLSSYGVRVEIIGNDVKLLGLPKLTENTRKRIITWARQNKKILLDELQGVEDIQQETPLTSEYEKELEDPINKRIAELDRNRLASWEIAPILNISKEEVIEYRQKVKAAALADFHPSLCSNTLSGKSKNDILPAPTPWLPEEEQLINWFLSGQHSFPNIPFTLSPGVHIIDPKKFYLSLKSNIAQGSEGPRAIYGALQSDIRKLKALCCL